MNISSSIKDSAREQKAISILREKILAINNEEEFIQLWETLLKEVMQSDGGKLFIQSAKRRGLSREIIAQYFVNATQDALKIAMTPSN